MKHKSKGDVLIFENENGASDFFFTSELKKMITQVKDQLSRRNRNNFATDMFSDYGDQPETPMLQCEKTEQSQR